MALDIFQKSIDKLKFEFENILEKDNPFNVSQA